MHGRIFLNKDKRISYTVFIGSYRADHSDSLRWTICAIWIRMWIWIYRSRFIGFTDFSPRSDTEFGLVFSGETRYRLDVSFFSRRDESRGCDDVACHKVFVNSIFIPEIYYRYLFLCMLSSKIFLYSYFHFCHQQVKRNLVTRLCLEKVLNMFAFNNRSFLCSASCTLLWNSSCVTQDKFCNNSNN